MLLRPRKNRPVVTLPITRTPSHSYGLRKRAGKHPVYNEVAIAWLYVEAQRDIQNSFTKRRKRNSHHENTGGAIPSPEEQEEEEDEMLTPEEDVRVEVDDAVHNFSSDEEMDDEVTVVPAPPVVKHVHFGEQVTCEIVSDDLLPQVNIIEEETWDVKRSTMKPTNISMEQILAEQTEGDSDVTIGSATPKSPAFSYKTLIEAGDVGYFAELHRSNDDEDSITDLETSTLSDAGGFDVTTTNEPTTVPEPEPLLLLQQITVVEQQQVKSELKESIAIVKEEQKGSVFFSAPTKMRTRHQERVTWICKVRDHCLTKLGAKLPITSNQSQTVNSSISSPLQRREQRRLASEFSPQKLSGKHKGIQLPNNITYFLKFLKWEPSSKLQHLNLGLHNIEFRRVVMNIDERYDVKYLYHNENAMIVGVCNEGYLVTHVDQSVDEYLRRLAPGSSLRSKLQNNLSFIREDFDFDFPVFLLRLEETKLVEGPIMLMDFLLGVSCQS